MPHPTPPQAKSVNFPRVVSTAGSTNKVIPLAPNAILWVARPPIQSAGRGKLERTKARRLKFAWDMGYVSNISKRCLRDVPRMYKVSVFTRLFPCVLCKHVFQCLGVRLVGSTLPRSTGKWPRWRHCTKLVLICRLRAHVSGRTIQRIPRNTWHPRIWMQWYFNGMSWSVVNKFRHAVGHRVFSLWALRHLTLVTRHEMPADVGTLLWDTPQRTLRHSWKTLQDS